MFHGSMVALVTPMKKNQEVDEGAFERLIEWHIDQKTDALVILGSTGEGSSLSPSERQRLIQKAVSIAKGKLPIIVGTGMQSTSSTIEATREAMQQGADACLIVTPPYLKPTQEGLYQHYKAVAEAVPIPQILYNVPSRTQSDLKPETVIRLASIPNIVGLKEATGDLSRVSQILHAYPKGIDLYSGDDQTCGDFMLLGGKGVVTVAGNIVPRVMHDLFEAALKHDRKLTWNLQHQLKPLYDSLSLEPNPVPVKWMLKEMGWVEAGIRLPLLSLNEAFYPRLKKVLKDLKELDWIDNN